MRRGVKERGRSLGEVGRGWLYGSEVAVILWDEEKIWRWLCGVKRKKVGRAKYH